ncbi:Hypothetical predicted protein [Cloeon dipterum]|uniref:RCC1-like domain-containing protein n=1 Tax=Cloeon dipterum TaxID=197152 RepID=A0A8S1C5H9_9INSE|nr:Hypothetical predicted protein [Cloeon dipterum]
MKLISWGANQFGQLAHKGWPVFEASNTPKQCSLDGLPDDILSNISNICGGGGHTLLLDSDGCVWACGQNNRGQCGAPTDAEIKTITPWTKVDINGLKVRQVAAGWEHSAAVTDNGHLYVWGSNSHGQLGQVVERGKCTYQPHCMAENVKKVSAGLRQTTWINTQNVINCSSSTGENKITVPGVLKPIQLASGQKHNVVLMANAENDERLGQIFCWGDNKFGQLATGLDGGKSVELVEAEASKEKEFLNIACGWSHSAGITADGRLMCWGRSNYGQLGCPEQVDKRGPFTWFHNQEQQVKVTQIALGSEHTLALTGKKL